MHSRESAYIKNISSRLSEMLVLTHHTTRHEVSQDLSLSSKAFQELQPMKETGKLSATAKFHESKRCRKELISLSFL